MPDEVVILLKPSGDRSEEVISKFSQHLPIKLLVQREGNVVRSDIILFLDARRRRIRRGEVD